MLLNLGEDVLLELLTYHQVPSCFLNFLTSGGGSWGFASGTRPAGFRGATSLRPSGGGGGPGIASLGRSGKYLQFSLALSSMREHPAHALPRDASPEKTPRWEAHSAAVYLHFDVVEGTAVWFIASPRSYHPSKGSGKQNLLWNTIKENAAGTLEGVASSDVPGRFRVSLDGVLAVAEWSVEGLSPHLRDLEMRLSELVRDVSQHYVLRRCPPPPLTEGRRSAR